MQACKKKAVGTRSRLRLFSTGHAAEWLRPTTAAAAEADSARQDSRRNVTRAGRTKDPASSSQRWKWKGTVKVLLYNAEHAKAPEALMTLLPSSQRERNLHIYLWRGWWNVYENKITGNVTSFEFFRRSWRSWQMWDENEEYAHVLYSQRLEEHSRVVRKTSECWLLL